MTKRNKSVFFTLFLMIGLCFGAWYFHSYLISRPQSALTNISFSPKWVNQPQFAGIFVAINKGIYKKHGLNVSVKEFSGNSSVINDLENGVSQFGLMSANELLTKVAQGKAIKGIAAFYQFTPFILVSLKQLNITSPTELRGKTLGIKGGKGAEGESIYAILLKAVNLAPEDVKFAYLPFGTSEYEDLIAEKADIIGLYRTDQLYYFEKNNTGYNVLFPEQYGAAIYNDVLVSKSDYLEANPDIAKSFVKATREGWEYALSHEDEALAITANYVTNQTYIDPGQSKYIFDKSRSLIDTGATKIGSMSLDSWKEYAKSLQYIGVLPEVFDVKAAITTDFLP